MVEQPVTFDGTSSSCPSAPCTYEWSDDGGTTRPIPPLWPLGSGPTLSFTFSGAGMKYVRLVVRDALGQTATAEHNVAVTPAPVLKPEPEPEPEPEPPVSEPEPEPVAPPTNSTMPAISGTTTEGQQLTTTHGTWSGNPTSYTYQWRHCNSSGHSCSSIAGATTSHYTLATSDVGHTMRVMVTAANEAGASSMSSPTTATVTASAPAAPTNTALPAISGTATEGQRLSATAGTWTGSPTSFTYQWQDCNSTDTSCANITGASASSYTLAAGDVGDTVRVVVSASNAGGATSASSNATAIVAEPQPEPQPEPEPVAPPTNSTMPAISGTTTEGQQLTATHGTWSGNPTSYTYQWQRCNGTGGGCSNLSGAGAQTYSLSASDVGSTMRVVVSAGNSGGTTAATSTQTATVAAHAKQQQTGCFGSLGACGYPDPTSGNVGTSTACSSLTPSGEITVSTAGATVQNMNISGGVNIAAKNVTLTNDCISGSGYHVVFLNGGATGFQITHSNVFGSPSVQEAINNNNDNAGALADHDYIYNCGECVHGAWTLTNSYVTTNATISGEHYEDIYCSDETFVAEHDVLINPHEQTANLFCNADGGGGGPADNHITLTNSLLAGGGYSLYTQGNSTSIGTSTMKIVGNRFARCLTKSVTDREGDVTCSGGADENGYWPNGGYYGIDAYTYCPPAAGQEWSNNVWDDNNASVGC